MTLLTADTFRRLAIGLTSESAATEIDVLLRSVPGGKDYFVDTFLGANVNDGLAPGEGRAKATLAAALALVATGDRIWVKGDVREENLVCSNLVFDVKIIGMGGLHHPDQPSSAYDPGAAMIRPPASPTATTPLLVVRGRGWEFINLAFDCPVDAAAIQLNRNASSGTSEYDAGHAVIQGCRFSDGKWAIQNAGGCGFVKVRRNRFQRLTETGGAGIVCTSTSVAVPLNWEIEDNIFVHNASHILSSMSYSVIRRNIFGRFTGTLSIDIDDQPSSNQGEYNVITENYLSGTFGITAYPAGTNNEWAGNQNVGGVTSADPT